MLPFGELELLGEPGTELEEEVWKRNSILMLTVY